MAGGVCLDFAGPDVDSEGRPGGDRASPPHRKGRNTHTIPCYLAVKTPRPQQGLRH
jgi:hypothetical protein